MRARSRGVEHSPEHTDAMDELPEDRGVTLVKRMRAMSIPDQQLRGAAGRAEFIRIRRGAYAHRSDAARPDRDAAYLRRVVAVVGTRRGAVTLSHHSAALLHGLPVADDWPQAVHITEDRESRRRSKNGVVVHRSALHDSVDGIDGMLVTSLARTVIDIAADGTFSDAVCVADAALRAGLGRDALWAELERRPGPGRARAARVVEFADGAAETSLESWSRASIDELGFPRPVLQFPVITPSGVRRLDFAWPEAGAGAEADGLWKYGAVAEAQGRTGLEAFRIEKEREAEVRLHLRAFTRWGIGELRDREKLRLRLLSLGLRPLPSYRPQQPPR
jgi:hypothetical protein